jgi:hypothetical protein
MIFEALQRPQKNTPQTGTLWESGGAEKFLILQVVASL